MWKVACAAVVASLVLAGCGVVPAATEPVPAASPAAMSLDDAVQRLDTSDHAWAGAQKAKIVSVYADLVNDKVKVLVGPGANTKAVTAAAKRITGLVPVVEAAPPKASNSQPLGPEGCSCSK